MSDPRIGDDYASRNRKLFLVIDVVAWSFLFLACGLVVALAFIPWGAANSGWIKILGIALGVALLPGAAGMSWLIFKGQRQLTIEGTDLANWHENFPRRLWPLLLPLLPMLGSGVIAFVSILIKHPVK